MNLQVYKLTVKAKLLAIILIAFAAQVMAQDNPITGITISLPANPDANIANWGTGTSTFIITARARTANGRIDPMIEESRILVIIKKDGKKALGNYTGGTAPAAELNGATKVWSGRNAASLIGQDGTLPPGDYELSVQFFAPGAAGKVVALSDEKTKGFTIRGNEQQAYQPPQPIAPANGSAFKEEDIKKPITFRWTPVIPKPQEPPTYRLKVWQLMQGQTGTQAMRTNQPIITKDVDNITQALITNLITGPCKPPYLCDFVWNVQALNREGKPIGGNNGTSELFNFKYDTGTPVTDDVKKSLNLTSPANGSVIDAGSLPLFKWEANIAGTPGYKIKITEIKGDQSPEIALRTNKPIFERDSLNALSFQYPASALALIPGRKYAWNVQTNGRPGKQGSEAESNPFTFSVASGGCVGKLTLKSISCGEYTHESFKYSVCVNYTSDAGNTCNIAYNNAQNATLNSLTGHSLANIIKDANGGTISNITFSPSPSNLIAPGQSVQVCFTLTSAQSYANIVTYGLCKDGKELIAPNFANDALALDLKACSCTYCDEIDKWKFDNESVTANGEAPFTVNLGTTITSPGVTITNFKAELVSFTQDGKQLECFGCNTDARSFGNFTGGTFGTWGNGIFPLYGSYTTHHTLSWFSASGASVNLAGSSINLSFTAPPLNPLGCCDDEISFCIRYSFTDKECRTCSFVKCYTVTRKHK